MDVAEEDMRLVGMREEDGDRWGQMIHCANPWREGRSLLSNEALKR